MNSPRARQQRGIALLALLAVAVMALGAVLRADEAPKAKADDKAPIDIKNEAAAREMVIAQKYREFELALVQLAQRLEKSTRKEDRDKALVLRQALETAGKSGVTTRMERLITLLRESKANNLAEIKEAIDQGERVVKADGFFVGLYATQLAADEILTQIRIPLPAAGSGWSYQKLKRKTGDFATAATAVMLQMKGRNVAKATIGLTNVGPTVLKAREAEAYLAGKEVNDASLNEAARLAMKICNPTADQRGDADYKRAMCGEMTRRALQTAHARAKG